MTSSCKIEGNVLIFRNILKISYIQRDKAASVVPLPPENVHEKVLKKFQEHLPVIGGSIGGVENCIGK